jgi:hypothetical protein
VTLIVLGAACSKLSAPHGTCGEIVANVRDSGCFANQPVAEIVQCGEPIPFGNSTTFARRGSRVGRCTHFGQ